MKHIVGFSGGIDSQACARWVLNRFPPADVILTNSDAGGWEDPLTIAFVEEYGRTVHPVVRCNAIIADLWRTPGFAETRGLDGQEVLTFERLVEIKHRAPSRQAQFCTQYLKLYPQRRWIEETFGPGGAHEGEAYVRYSGKRRDESRTRAGTQFEGWDEWFDCELRHPIADWTKQMCFDFVRAHGEEVNPLYSLGFERVGCAPCVNSGKDDLLNWQARRPDMITKVRDLEARTGRTFFRQQGPNGPMPIDEVLRWAGTARGGQERFLPMMLEREGCESKYGLCE